ncbi:hypothetical protein EV1_036987 [Malus domestica]
MGIMPLIEKLEKEKLKDTGDLNLYDEPTDSDSDEDDERFTPDAIKKSCNIDQDKAECADQLKSKKCLCVLSKDRNDPNLGLKINATLALNLPSSCHVPINISRCVDILNLPSNSLDVKMFRDYENKIEARSSTTASISSGNSTSSGTVAQEMSDGVSLGKSLMGIEMLFGSLLLFYIPYLVFYV